MMINVMVNQTMESGYKDTQAGVSAYLAQYSSRFAGLQQGGVNLDMALASPTTSNACRHLITSEDAFNQFWSVGGKPFAIYNQWRTAGAPAPAVGLVNQWDTIANTTFYNVTPLAPPVRRLPRR
jgi:hypothetical protein